MYARTDGSHADWRIEASVYVKMKASKRVEKGTCSSRVAAVSESILLDRADQVP